MGYINAKLKKKIMRRVYFIFFLRKISSSFSLKFYTLASFITFLILNVSLKNILRNMPNITDITALFNFSISAFTETEVIVQFFSIGVIIITTLLLKDISKIYNTHEFSAA
jgi:hypothetical protein